MDPLPGALPHSEALRARLSRELATRGPDYEARTRNLRPDGAPRFTNRLLLEGSPYLRQHAHNPVDWYPWSDEAFETAARLGRPVLVSIGYSTCHWCHVMEEESFDDPAVARLLNERFIAIKVDREARPDIDAVYMAGLHAMNQRGGWPLNVWVTPEREPFFGGTYFPPEDRGTRPGFAKVLRTIARRFEQEREQVTRSAEAIAAAMRAALRRSWAPNRVVSVVTEGPELEAHAELIPLWAGKRVQRGRATAYVCQNRVCGYPTSDPEVFSAQLAGDAPSAPERP
jgi:hypothetical protein